MSAFERPVDETSSVVSQGASPSAAGPAAGDWKYFKKEVTDWIIYLHLDDLNAFWDGERIIVSTGMVPRLHGVHLWPTYYYQSGAINEHMSDAFGEAVDQLNTAAGVPDDDATDTVS